MKKIFSLWLYIYRLSMWDFAVKNTKKREAKLVKSEKKLGMERFIRSDEE